MNTETRQRIADLLTNDDPDTRRFAAEEMATASDLATVTALTAALQDPSKGVRDAASRSLIAIGGASVARALAHYIADTEIVTRNLAAKLLMNIGSSSVPAILPFLRDHDKNVRKFAVDILGEIRSGLSVDHLLPLLEDDDPNVIVSTLEALGNIGRPNSVGAICRAFDVHAFARANAADALGRIADRSAAGFLLAKLRQAVTDPSYDPVVLFALIEAIGTVGDLEAARLLQELLQAVHGKLLHVLIHALVQITERRGLAIRFPESVRCALFDAIDDDDEGIRLSAAKALAHFRDIEVTRILVRTLGRSEDLDFLLISALLERNEAFEVAVEILEQKGARGVPQIILLLGKLSYEYVRRFSEFERYPIAESLLYRAFDAALVEWSVADHETRAIIVDTMFRLTGDRAVECMSEIAAEPDPWLRVHVIELMGEIRDRRAIDVVVTFLEDEDDMVREAALSLLQSRGFQSETTEYAEFS